MISAIEKKEKEIMESIGRLNGNEENIKIAETKKKTIRRGQIKGIERLLGEIKS